MPYTTALLVLGSAAIHFAVVPEHLREYVPFGLFFIAAGTAQVALATAILVAPNRRLLLAGSAGTAAIIALWAVSRTTGLPIGPSPGRPEAIGFNDLVCTTMEGISALLLARLATRTPRPPRPLWTAVKVIPALVPITVLTTVTVGGASNQMVYSFNASPIIPDRPSTNLQLLTEAPGSQPVKSFTLTAEVSRLGNAAAWAYNGTVPGPQLRVNQGDRLKVTLVNHLPVSTTIHWHGVPGLPAAEDGVAGVTQDAIQPGRSYTYEFVAEEPGTYWYHSHQDTGTQLTMGLYGALVVEPVGGATETRDYTVVLHKAVDANAVAVNGTTGDLHLDAGPGETVRLRIVNAFAPGMDGGPETPVLLGAPYRITALDGRDLNHPQPLGPERLPLGMGQRADLVFTMPATGVVRLVDAAEQGQTTGIQNAITSFFGGPTQRRATVTIGSGAIPTISPAELNRLPLFDLTRYGQPAEGATAGAAARPDATFSVVLDEHAGFHDGRIELLHTINGQVSPYVPPITVREGQLIRLHIVNQTGEYHPIHLHGHTLTLLDRNGARIQGSPVHLDTVLVAPHETWDVTFRADNPGIWMMHCHVLLHASMGMSMTVNYAGVSTPYEMGSRSGNMPE